MMFALWRTIFPGFTEWNLNLQEYDILFPGTRAIREELSRRNMMILGNRSTLQGFIDRTQPQLASAKKGGSRQMGKAACQPLPPSRRLYSVSCGSSQAR